LHGGSGVDRERNPIKRFLRILGPGLITGASDDDPSGIGTYAQAGATFGYTTLWTALLTLPLSATVQYICAKVGLVSGRGIAGVLRQHFPRAVLYPAVAALVIANTINAGVDIGAIAAALNLALPLPSAVFIVPVTLAILGLLIAGSYRLIAGVFKWLTLALLAYIGSAFFARPDVGDVLLHTFVPTFELDPRFILTVLAILGTTISPYLFFYQAEDEVETEISLGRRSLRQRKGAEPADLKFASWDVASGIGFSNVVFYFIVLASGATLHQAGTTDIGTAADAARALQPIAGDAAGLLFAAGIIGSGFLAVPILVASASYAVAETMGWKRGLDQKPRMARRFYVVIAASMLAGMAIDFIGIDPIDALFWTAVLNGLLAPPLLVLIMLVASDRKVMGRWTNGTWTNLAGWAAACLMASAAVAWAGLTILG
jgi:NRAMP (natural resistance-associated macrophage protein)-like metal ion transporter